MNPMKLQTCPNNWSCVATAFAIAVHVPVRMFFDFLGHDGSTAVFTNGARSGFHPAECIRYLQSFHFPYACTPIEVTPQHTNGEETVDVTGGRSKEVRLAWVRAFMQGRSGVVTGINPDGRGHAMAWNGHNFYDPAGVGIVYPATELERAGFQIDCFWWLHELSKS